MDSAPPDHSTISRTRRLIDLETHRAVFTWVLQCLSTAGLVKGKTIGIDATTLEANAALRSIVRRDTGESYQDFLTKLAQASGIKTPTRADLARLDRKRKKKGSNDDWTHPHDPDAKITKMKDGRTHLAHKAEHAVDLETGAIVAITVQGADQGDTTTIQTTLPEAAEQLEAVAAVTDDVVAVIDEVVADKGYHSRQTVHDLETLEIRTYISEPDRGPQSWIGQEAKREAVYANRRRIRGHRGHALLHKRGELLERPCAHLYETGGLRRTHLRGHENILKRLLVHASACNLGLWMRTLVGVGTPRGLQGRLAALGALLSTGWTLIYDAMTVRSLSPMGTVAGSYGEMRLTFCLSRLGILEASMRLASRASLTKQLFVASVKTQVQGKRRERLLLAQAPDTEQRQTGLPGGPEFQPGAVVTLIKDAYGLAPIGVPRTWRYFQHRPGFSIICALVRSAEG